MSPKVSVIDLFAGPGGLGEGFSAFRNQRGQSPFDIRLSVEMEPSAHRTLTLRAFYRHLQDEIPDAYYNYLKGEISKSDLFAMYPEAGAEAAQETLGVPTALGDDAGDRKIYRRLRELRRDDCPWVVIGGPPCQAYSLVGRARNKGVAGYKAEKDHRHFLYQEYLQVLWTMRPEAFVMENVKGILSSRVDGQRVFPRILEDLSHPGRALGKRGGKGYTIYALGTDASTDDLVHSSGSDFVVRSELFGIPQARHRVILLGVRNDLNVRPPALTSQQQQAAGNVLGDLTPLRSGLSKGTDSPNLWAKAVQNAASIVQPALSKLGLDKKELDEIVSKSLKLRSRGGRTVTRRRKFRGDDPLTQWYIDKNLKVHLNHETRGHIVADLARYLFCSCFGRLGDNESPRAHQFPEMLAPNHTNWNSGKFVDRFKVQLPDRPSSTITSHISKDGHYYIHFDPSQCRSLTVREAARLQTFPDNYFFEGNRTQQYVQVGNAVPPLLAHQIARIVHETLKLG
jgi:DNA (cytosine-5)-methyltransferase 1